MLDSNALETRLIHHREPNALASGDMASGDMASGDMASGDMASRDTASGDTASGDMASGDMASGDTASRDMASGDTASRDTASNPRLAPTAHDELGTTGRWPLFGRDGADNAPSLMDRRGLHLAKFKQFRDHAFHDTVALLDVRDFSATEDNRDLHLILILQKLLGLFDLKINIVLARLGTQTNLFGLRLVRMSPVQFLAALVLKLSVVHDSADGGLFLGRHLHQIESIFAGYSQCLLGRNDAELRSIGIDDTDLRNANLFVDPDVRAFDHYSLSF